jgi:hypothetical protein
MSPAFLIVQPGMKISIEAQIFAPDVHSKVTVEA